MSREVHHTILATFVMLLSVVGSAQLSAPIAELHDAVRAAHDADLKGDWEGLVNARTRVAAAEGRVDPTLVSYYLGYVDWRMSSLAYLVTGPSGMVALLDRALEHLRASVTATPTFAEGHALLATCAGILSGTDPSRVPVLGPIIKNAWAAALEHGASNPRVQLLRAMMEFFAPPQYGGNRERGLERWKEAIRLFEAEAKSQRSAQAVAWGHAEAWAWLGGAYLMIGRPDDARAALEQAIRLRPDFWWAAQIALPQARRPAATDRSKRGAK